MTEAEIVVPHSQPLLQPEQHEGSLRQTLHNKTISADWEASPDPRWTSSSISCGILPSARGIGRISLPQDGKFQDGAAFFV